MRLLFKLLGMLAMWRAIRRGPGAVGRLMVRRRAHRAVRKAL